MKMITEAEYADLKATAVTEVCTASDVVAAAMALAAKARRAGFVLTIHQQPLEPLAMGNHDDAVSVREARR